MKTISIIAIPILSIGLFLGAYFYFQYKETDYDSVLAIAVKKQKAFSEFVDFYGEIEPNLPDQTINAKTISGVDTNNNDVRDDIDVWINRTAYEQNETKAMRQYAKSIQDYFKLCEQNNYDNVKTMQEALLKAEKCLESLSDYQRKATNFAKEKLNILLYNTSARISCKESYQKNIENIRIGDSSHFHCNFDIRYPDNVTFGNNEWNKSRSIIKH